MNYLKQFTLTVVKLGYILEKYHYSSQLVLEVHNTAEISVMSTSRWSVVYNRV